MEVVKIETMDCVVPLKSEFDQINQIPQIPGKVEILHVVKKVRSFDKIF